MKQLPWIAVYASQRPNDKSAFVMTGDGITTICALNDMTLARLIVDAHNEELRLVPSMEAVSEANVALDKLLDPAQHYVVVATEPYTPHAGWLDYHATLSGKVPGEEFGYEHGPLVWETHVGKWTTLSAAKERAEQQRKHGCTDVRIARLEFLPGEA